MSPWQWRHHTTCRTEPLRKWCTSVKVTGRRQRQSSSPRPPLRGPGAPGRGASSDEAPQPRPSFARPRLVVTGSGMRRLGSPGAEGARRGPVGAKARAGEPERSEGEPGSNAEVRPAPRPPVSRGRACEDEEASPEPKARPAPRAPASRGRAKQGRGERGKARAASSGKGPVEPSPSRGEVEAPPARPRRV